MLCIISITIRLKLMQDNLSVIDRFSLRMFFIKFVFISKRFHLIVRGLAGCYPSFFLRLSGVIVHRFSLGRDFVTVFVNCC